MNGQDPLRQRVKLRARCQILIPQAFRKADAVFGKQAALPDLVDCVVRAEQKLRILLQRKGFRPPGTVKGGCHLSAFIHMDEVEDRNVHILLQDLQDLTDGAVADKIIAVYKQQIIRSGSIYPHVSGMAEASIQRFHHFDKIRVSLFISSDHFTG